MKKPNFPACNIANAIIKAAKADTWRTTDVLHHIYYNSDTGFAYATDGKRMLRGTAADFGVNPDTLNTGYYDLILIDGYPRFVPVDCPYTFPNCEAIIPAANDVFTKFHYEKGKDADENAKRMFYLQSLVFHASRQRSPQKPAEWQILSTALLDAIDKSGTGWDVIIPYRGTAIRFQHENILLVIMPMRGVDNRGVLEACGLWPKAEN